MRRVRRMSDLFAVEPNQWKDALRLEAELGLPAGFLDALFREDDWTFLIKIHALLEAAATHLVVKALDEPRLEGILSQLDIGDSRAGTIAVIKSLDLLPPFARRYLRAMSRIRNKVIHDVQQVSFSFEDYVKSLDSNQLHEHREAFRVVELKAIGFEDEEPPKEWWARNAKSLAMQGALLILTLVYLRVSVEDARQEIQRLAIERLEREDHT